MHKKIIKEVRYGFFDFNFYYGAVFGKGDGSDIFEWEIDLDEEQQKLFKKAVMTRQSLEGISEFGSLISEAYDEIKEQETDNMLDCGDEYTQECMGETEMNTDELNDLVHDVDDHALEFFGLQELSEEERQEWDANVDLDELPLVKDFNPDFGPTSPFDEGWYLSVNAPEVTEIDIEDYEIEDYISEALDNQDYALAWEVIVAQNDYYGGDIWSKGRTIDESKGCIELLMEIANEKSIKVLGECYRTGRFETLFDLLHEGCTWESQWVLEPRKGKEALIQYYRDKGRMIIESKSYPDCYKIKLVDNINMIDNASVHVNGGASEIARVGYWYEEGKICLLSVQTCNGSTNGVVMEIILEDNLQIARIDLADSSFYKYEIICEIKEES